MVWGGAEEQKREQEAGNQHAKNWHDEAIKVVEKTMEEYWSANSVNTPAGMSTNTSATLEPDNNTLKSDFDRQRRLWVTQNANSRAEDGVMELHRYLADPPADVTKETNIIDWWVVSPHL